MTNPRLRHLPGGKKPKTIERSEQPLAGTTTAIYAAREDRIVERLMHDRDPTWFIRPVMVNPARVIEEAESSPMMAALMLHNGCKLLGKGHHIRVREYLTAGFAVANKMRGKKTQIQQLADLIIDGRTKESVSYEIVEDSLLHYLFIYVFFMSGLVTRDRATQYAQSLQSQFDRGLSVEEVDRQLIKYGQNGLRLAAQLSARLTQGVQEWIKQGKDPNQADLASVLQSIDDENHKGTLGDGQGSECVGSQISEDRVKLEPSSNEISADLGCVGVSDKVDETDYDGFDSELPPHHDPRHGDDDELEQISELSVFFRDITVLIARLGVGVSVENPNSEQSAKNYELVRALAVKVMLFQGSMG